MLEDREARREARRRKILENSANRLNKITGVQNRTTSFEIDGYKSSDTSNQPNDSPSTNGDLQHQDIRQTNSSQLQDILLRNSILQQPTKTDNLKSNLDTYRVPIIISIALIQNMLLIVLNIRQIFALIVGFEAIDILFYSKHEPSPFLVKVLTLMKVNIPKRKLVVVVRCLNLLKKFFRDVLLYFFSFICIFFVQSCCLQGERIEFVS